MKQAMLEQNPDIVAQQPLQEGPNDDAQIRDAQPNRLPPIFLESLILETVSDAIVATDGTGIITVWNRGAERLYWRSSAQALGRRLDEVFETKWPTLMAHRRAMKSLKKRGEWSGELTHRLPDGTEIPLRASVRSISHEYPDSDGQLWVFAPRNASAAVEEVDEAEIPDDGQRNMQLDLILDNIPVAVSITDSDGRIIWLNAQVQKIWGKAAGDEDLSTYDSYQGWWPETGQKLAPHEWTAKRVLSQKQPIQGEIIEIERFDDCRAFVLSSAVPLFDDSGELIGAMGIMEDITEQRMQMTLNETMSEIARVVHSSLETEDILMSTLDIASTALGTESAGVVVRSEKGWRVVFAHGPVSSMALKEFTPEQLPAATEAARTRDINIIYEPDIPKSDETHAEVVTGSAAMSIPLIVRDEVVGVLTFLRMTQGTFSAHQITFGRHLGPSVSLALENARLFESAKLANKKTHQELAINRVLLKSIGTLTQGIKLSDTLAALVHSAIEATGVCRVSVGLYDKKRDVMRVVASHGENRLPGGLVVAMNSLPQEVVDALEARRPIEFDVAAHDLSPDLNELATLAGAVRVLIVPLHRDDRLVGIMVLDEPGVHVMFGEREVEITSAIAAQAAVAIENAQLFERHREDARLNGALNEIDRTLHSMLEIEEIMRRALEEGGKALGAESGSIAWRMKDSVRTVLAFGFEDDMVGLELPEDVDRHGRLSAFTGETIAVTDVKADRMTDHRLFDYLPIKSMVLAPLVVRGETRATIYFHYTTAVHTFTRSEVSFVTRLASSLSLALENAELFQEKSRQAVLADALNTIGADINETLDFNAALDLAIPTAITALGFDWAAIVSQDGAMRTIEKHWGQHPELKGRRFHLDDEALGRLNQVLTIDDVVRHERLRKIGFADLGVRALISAPLARVDEVFGHLLICENDEPHRWKAQEIDFVTALAAHLSLAAQNSHLYEEERQRAKLNQALNDIDNIIYSAARAQDIISSALAMGIEAIGARSGSVTLRDEDAWVIRYEHGLGREMLGYAFTSDEWPYTSDFLRGSDVMVFVHPPGSPEILKHRRKTVCLTASAAVPLTLRGEIFGLMYLNHHEDGKTFNPSQIEFAKKLGASVSLALENLRLFEAERRTVHLAETLTRVNELLLSTLSVDVMMESIVAEAANGSGAHCAMLLKPDQDDWVVANAFGIDEELESERLDADFAESFTRVAGTRQPLLVGDALRDSEEDVKIAARFGFRSFILTPLVAGADLLGILCFGYWTPSIFEDKDLQFASRLSTAIALALENARLYQTERHIAETLQDTLLVMPKHIRGIEFARFYRSATVSTKVGGDYIDAFQLTSRRVAISLGDVSGKGLEAASITATVRNTMRAHAVEGLPPAQVAEKTNTLLRLFTSIETFVTAFFGLLDTRTGRLVYVSAGHPDTLVLSPDGQVRRLETHSPVLGAFDNVAYKEGQTYLEPGEILFAYSDGLTEARGEDGMFGEDRVVELLASMGATNPQMIISKMFSAVEEYSGGEFRDDIALLAVCRDTDAAEDETAQDHFDFHVEPSPQD